MKVVHLSYWDNVGGSGRAAYRIHRGLRLAGASSRMLVAHKATDDPDVGIIGGRSAGRIDRLIGRSVDRLGWQYLGYPSSWALPWMRAVREADVVQLFNTHGGYFSHLALGSLARHRPLVWRLSDMWALTGHCGYSYECERWLTGCGACPHLDEYPALPRDTTAMLWRTKRELYARTPLTIVSPSRWLADCARRSPLLGHYPVHVIPNGLDTDVFRPQPRAAARARFGIADDARVILFSAVAVDQVRKGGAYLREALGRLADTRLRATLLVVGRGAGAWSAGLPFPVRAVDHLDDDAALAASYAAADVFVLPTVAENLPNGILEAMACGTPAVAFEVGGVPDVVRHLETGYLAAPRDAAGLAKGVELLLADDDLRARLGHESRATVEREHGLLLQARRFLAVYEGLRAR
ncbi:MAG: glycosyltransferase family 4 protein [Candidatus Rokubacteria bacterium]|nr:glycosyltransferase family 4 protein [Candidatus Rokubacteria bacterium]